MYVEKGIMVLYLLLHLESEAHSAPEELMMRQRKAHTEKAQQNGPQPPVAVVRVRLLILVITEPLYELTQRYRRAYPEPGLQHRPERLLQHVSQVRAEDRVEKCIPLFLGLCRNFRQLFPVRRFECGDEPVHSIPGAQERASILRAKPCLLAALHQRRHPCKKRLPQYPGLIEVRRPVVPRVLPRQHALRLARLVWLMT